MNHMIKAALAPTVHPERAPLAVRFPVPDEEYDCTVEQLETLGMGDALRQDCRVDGLDSGYSILKRLEGATVNVDQLDFLAKRLDSFNSYETAQFQTTAYELDISDIQDFINLTFCCQQVTVITDFSDLDRVGRDHRLVRNGGGILMDEYQAVDGRKEALRLITGGGGTITPYGVVYDNGMVLEPVYDGRHFPAYLYTTPLLMLEVTSAQGSEYLYLPASERKIQRTLLRAGDPETLQLRIEMDELPEDVSSLLDLDHLKVSDLEGLDRLQMAYLFGTPVLYSSEPIPREDVPLGWYCYDLCGTNRTPDIAYALVDQAEKNYAGSVLSYLPLKNGRSQSRLVGDMLQPTGEQGCLADFCAEEQISCPETPLRHLLRPASPEEAGLFYAQTPERDEELGIIGRVRIDFGYCGKEFHHSWWPRGSEELNTPEFREELGRVVDDLRKGVLKDLSSMRRFCYGSEGAIGGGTCCQNYGFTLETERYLYRLRCNPAKGDYQCYLTCCDKQAQAMYLDHREEKAPDQPESVKCYTIDEFLAQMEPQHWADQDTVRRCIAGLTDYAAQLAARDQGEQIPQLRRLRIDMAEFWGLAEDDTISGYQKMEAQHGGAFDSAVSAAQERGSAPEMSEQAKQNILAGLELYAQEMTLVGDLEEWIAECEALSGQLRAEWQALDDFYDGESPRQLEEQREEQGMTFGGM